MLARATTGAHHDLRQALRYVKTNVIRCWKGVRFAKHQGAGPASHYQRTDAMDARHTVEVV